MDLHVDSRTLLKQWSFWSLLLVAFFLALDIATNLLNFPIRLLLLQVELWLAEQTWRHRMAEPDDEYETMAEYASA